MTFETLVQSDEKTWHDQEKIEKDKYKDKDNDNDKDKNILRTPPKSNPRDLWPLRHGSAYLHIVYVQISA